MGALMRNLNRLKVTATSPDGKIKASLDFRERFTCGVADAATFASYDRTALADQLGAVLCSVREALRRGTRMAYEDAGYTVDPAGTAHWDARRRRYHEAVAATVATGKSRNGLIMIRAGGGLDDYRVKLHPKALEQLGMDQFILEVRSAHAKLMEEARTERNRLRREMLPD